MCRSLPTTRPAPVPGWVRGPAGSCFRSAELEDAAVAVEGADAECSVGVQQVVGGAAGDLDLVALLGRDAAEAGLPRVGRAGLERVDPDLASGGDPDVPVRVVDRLDGLGPVAREPGHEPELG